MILLADVAHAPRIATTRVCNAYTNNATVIHGCAPLTVVAFANNIYGRGFVNSRFIEDQDACLDDVFHSSWMIARAGYCTVRVARRKQLKSNRIYTSWIGIYR